MPSPAVLPCKPNPEQEEERRRAEAAAKAARKVPTAEAATTVAVRGKVGGVAQPVCLMRKGYMHLAGLHTMQPGQGNAGNGS